MNKYFLSVFLSVFMFLSCSQYIDLGTDKSMASNDAPYEDDMEWDSDSEAYDNSADKGDTGYDYGDAGDSDAGSDSYDEGSWDSGDNNGASYEENDSCEEADDSDYSESADTDFDNSDTDLDDSGDETDSGSGEDGIFPEDFSNEECDCGDEPGYHPICCDGKTLVFNACFANCYAVNSNGRICAFYEIGLCSDETDDSEDDDEQPDNDEDFSEIPNECGCYPDEKPELFACMQSDNVTFFMSSCLAECHCDDPKKVIE